MELVNQYKGRNEKFGDFEYFQKYYTDTEGICTALNVNMEQGPLDADNDERKLIFGTNEPPPLEVEGFCKILANQIAQFIIIVLLISAVVSMAIDTTVNWKKLSLRKIAWVNGFGILVAVIIVVLVGTINDWQKEKQFIKLNSLNEDAKQVVVIRNGVKSEKNYKISDLLVGDIVCSSSGTIIPADGIMISGKVVCNEASITGESDNLYKYELSECFKHKDEISKGRAEFNEHTAREVASPILLAGARVVDGNAKFIVIAVGDRSTSGQIRKSLLKKSGKKSDKDKEGDKNEANKPQEEKPEGKQEESKKEDIKDPKEDKKDSKKAEGKKEEEDEPEGKGTPLEQKLDKLAKDIGKMGLIASILVVAVLFLRFFIFRGLYKGWSNADIGTCFKFLLQGITLICVAIPEGLPLAVLIALAYSIKKMQKDQNFVKKMFACETMGGADNICSDKTGTLTKNKMAVTDVFINNSDIHCEIKKSDTEDPFHKLKINNDTLHLLMLSIGCNSDLETPSATDQAFLDFYFEAIMKHQDVLPEKTEYDDLVKKSFEEEKAKGINKMIKKVIVKKTKNAVEEGPKEKVKSFAEYYEEIKKTPEYSKTKTNQYNLEDEVLKIYKQFCYENHNSFFSKACYKRLSSYVYEQIPFNSIRKRTSTILTSQEFKDSPINQRIFTKGASDILLNTCTHFYTENGVVPMTEKIRSHIEGVLVSYAKKALRTLVMSYKDVQPNEGGEKHLDKDHDGFNEIEKERYVFFGLVGIKDTIREEVPDAILKCNKAGITVRMVTGDNITTAIAIANEIGIFKGHAESEITDENAVEGKMFENTVRYLECKTCKKTIKKGEYMKLKDKSTADGHKDAEKYITEPCKCSLDNPNIKFKERTDYEIFNKKYLTKLCVMARSLPRHKKLLVKCIRKAGSVVAVTGDGTNDAPALNAANVGFAMGIAGTDVAKEAAAIILLDDNFASIVKAVMWGRNIYENIRKFIQFQLTVNVVALIVNLITAVITQECPLTSIQLLWINLIMDSFASLELATQPPTEELLDRKPYGKDEYIISRKMMKHIIGQALYQLIVMCVVIFAGEYFIPEKEFSELVTYTYDNGTSVSASVSYTHDHNGKIRTGRRYTYAGRDSTKGIYDTEQYSQDIYNYAGPSRHYTIVFCIFIYCQSFNELNARKINDEWNIFDEANKNPMFLTIWLGTVGVTVILIEFGGRVFSCHKKGLTWEQWLICMAFAIGPLLVRIPLKFFPDRFCPQVYE